MRRLRRAHQKQVLKQVKKRKKLKQRAIAAGTAAAITLGAGVTLKKALAYIPDPHELPVKNDTDADLLADVEETALGYRVFNPDQNRNQIPDGVDLAQRCAAAIEQLPWQDEAEPNETYKWCLPTYGLETCDICGATVNMGEAGIVNPRLGLHVDCPLVAIHYMQHGSFSYAGDVHNGRIDVTALARALELPLPFEPNDHQMPVQNDADQDLLSNREEYAIGYRPFRPDQNRNEIPDGPELAKRCADIIRQLPIYKQAEPNETYKLESPPVDGMEHCDVCGEMIYMGGWYIINPSLHLQYPEPNDPNNWDFLPELAIHYMQHGSFDFYGTANRGRADIARLLRVLELRYPHEPDNHQLPVDGNDLDGDLLTDTEELAAGYNLYDPDQDEDLTPDGIELARQCGRAIDELPVYETNSGYMPPNKTYKENRLQRGIEQCGVCGAWRNMGYWQVINPKLRLSIEVPDIVCHYMEHGSFSYAGDVHGRGRINIPLLVKILEMPVKCRDLGTLYRPADLNEDCRENFTDFAEFANKWLECTDPNEDGCTTR